MVLPQIAFVGRPNVGKSSLFNRLGKKHHALVDDRAGVTRDLLYTTLALSAKGHCLLVDSPGYREAKAGLARLMLRQARRAWHDADLLLLVGDGLAGITSEDEQLAQHLRKADRPTWLLVNKLDDGKVAPAASFYALGLPVFSVSAQSGFGLNELRAALSQQLTNQLEQTEHDVDPDEARFALLGKPNVGKSSLFNCLVGEDRQLVHHEPGSTRDAVHLPLHHGKWTIRLSDTAGLRRKKQIDDDLERNAVAAALGTAARCDLVIYLLDSQQDVSAQDLRLLYLVEKMGKGLVLAVTKIDRLRRQQLAARKTALRQQLALVGHADLILTSATRNWGTHELLQTALNVRTRAAQHWPRRQLNQILAGALLKMAPPLAGAIRPQLRYVHQIDTQPPHLAFHGRRLHKLPATYMRYLRNHFRAALNLAGCPLRLSFKNDTNPYAG